jgi:hypothetical protein
MNNRLSGMSGCAGVSGVVGGNGFMEDEKLEKVGLKLMNIFHDNHIKSYKVCDKNGITKVISQEQYDNIYNNYIRNKKLDVLKNKK